MLIRALIAGFLSGLLVSYSFGCGGGGSAQLEASPPLAAVVAVDAPVSAVPAPEPAPPAVASDAGPVGTLAFEELWERRTQESGVFGIVTPQPMVHTADGSDPQLPWAMNKITGRWGTLRGSDGTIAGISIDVLGTGPNPWWSVDGGRLAFYAHPQTSPQGDGVGGWALISRQIFARSGRIVAETELDVTAAGPGGFAGMALITGEGDYRELAIRFEGGQFFLKRNTPLRETVLAALIAPVARLRIEYDPVAGFRYLLNGRLVGTEAIDHEGASFAADPQVALYFTGEGGVAGDGSFVKGFVGPVRVWTGAPVPAVIKEAGNA